MSVAITRALMPGQRPLDHEVARRREVVLLEAALPEHVLRVALQRRAAGSAP